MSHDIQNIVEYIKYVTYQVDVAISILLNDSLNLHVREDNISSYTSVPSGDKHRLTVTLDRHIRESDTGSTYHGTVELLYDKIDAGLVFPNGFYSHKHPVSDTISIPNLLSILKKNTRMIIDESEIEIEVENDQTYIYFKETSIFWKGRIKINSMDSIQYVES